MKRGPRRPFLLAFLTGVLFLVGVASAQWLADGSGSGTAKALTVEPLTTVSVASSATADLYPGGSGGLTLRISNPNPFPVTVADVTGAGAITSDVAACDAGGHGVSLADQTGLVLPVAGEGEATHTIAGVVHMADTSDPACAGAVFTIPVALAGYSGGTPPVDGGGGDGGDGGDVIAFYDGPEGTRGVGVCQDGTKDGDGNVLVAPVYPTPERSNGLDDDCNGVADDDIVVGYLDADADGWGVDSQTADVTWTDDGAGSWSYTYPEGYVDVHGDCDDGDPHIHPGQIEVVGNGVDDDCDGMIE